MRSLRQFTAALAMLLISGGPGLSLAQPATPDLVYADGKITGDVEQMPLDMLLKKLAAAGDFKLVCFAELQTTADVDVQALPLEDLLRQLLKGYSYAYQTDPERSPGDITRLFVFQSGGDLPATRTVSQATTNAESSAAEPAVEPGSDEAANRLIALEMAYSQNPDEYAAALAASVASDGDAAVRSRAIAILADLGGDTAYDAIAGGLGDTEPALRKQALDALVAIDREKSYPAMGQMLLGDSNPQLRLHALKKIGERRDEVSTALIQAGTDDKNDAVSKLAHELLR